MAEIKNVTCDYLFCFIGGIMEIAYTPESVEIYKTVVSLSVPEKSMD